MISQGLTPERLVHLWFNNPKSDVGEREKPILEMVRITPSSLFGGLVDHHTGGFLWIPCAVLHELSLLANIASHPAFKNNKIREVDPNPNSFSPARWLRFLFSTSVWLDDP